MRILRRLLIAVLFVGVLVLGWRFAADHSTGVVIRTPLSPDTEVTLWMALLLSFALGVVVTGSLAAVHIARQGLLARRYRKLIRNLEAEIHQLRNLPLADEPPSEAEADPPESPERRRALGRGA